MFYQPSVVPSDPAQLGQFLQQELARLALTMSQPASFVALDTLYAAPKRIFEGMVIKADGTTWNPGAGSGVYVYRDAAWHLLG